MKCANCQADLGSGDQFCGDCGNPVQAGIESPPYAEKDSRKPPPHEPSRGRPIIAIFALLLIAAVVAYALINRDTEENPESRLRTPANHPWQPYEKPEESTVPPPTSDSPSADLETEGEWVPLGEEEGMRELGNRILDQLERDLEKELEEQRTRNP